MKFINRFKKAKLKKFVGEGTVLLTGINSFSNITGPVTATPEELLSILNNHISFQKKIIHKHSGTVLQYAGDSILSFWNSDNPDYIRSTFDAAMEIYETFINKIKIDAQLHYSIKLSIATGKLTGDYFGQMKQYQIIGEAYNLAKKIDSINCGNESIILLCSNTAKSLGTVDNNITLLSKDNISGNWGDDIYFYQQV